jgi:Uma2 family endonuclease
MPLHEIVLPETKPETEWVRGRALQKVSPQRDHSRLQGAMTMRLDRWAAGRGEVGPEWRFRVAPPGEVRRPVVPDVAYVSNERLRSRRLRPTLPLKFSRPTIAAPTSTTKSMST